jgi:alpha-tubulin suppressor-like RCC1 family protein
MAVQGSSVFAWGRNTEGEFGNSSTINRSSPIQVSALDSPTVVDAGNNYTMTISSTGGGLGVGDNTYGQLGDGT